MTTPANTGRKQAKGQFAPGQSGNPKGKPAGSRHRLTTLAEKLMDAEAKGIIEAVIEAAKAGDMTAARLVLERIAPVRKGRPVAFDLPKIDTALDVLTALSAVIKAVSEGALTIDEAASVATLLETNRKALETVAIEDRLTALEKEKSK